MSNGQADALSRQPNYNQGENNNQNVVVLPDHLFIRATHMEWIEENKLPALIPIEDMEKAHPVYEQDKEMLKAWVDPHKLKKIEGT